MYGPNGIALRVLSLPSTAVSVALIMSSPSMASKQAEIEATAASPTTTTTTKTTAKCVPSIEPTINWWQDRGLRSLNLRLLAVFLSPLMIGYDGTLIGSLLTMPHCKYLSVWLPEKKKQQSEADAIFRVSRCDMKIPLRIL